MSQKKSGSFKLLLHTILTLIAVWIPCKDKIPSAPILSLKYLRKFNRLLNDCKLLKLFVKSVKIYFTIISS